MLSQAHNRIISTQLKPLFLATTRNFSPKTHPQDDGTYKGMKPKRMGYEAHHHVKGLLPRLNRKEPYLATLPLNAKEDDWSRRLATMGQNDMIKILGDEEVEQHELLTHIPDWIRGYRNMGKEYSVLMRKRKEFDFWKVTKPLKWLHMEQRIKFLYRRINNKYAPPDVEKLSRSRHKI